MAAPSPGTVRFKEVSSTPSTPPAGYCSIYAKTDNVLYLLDSSGVEIALGSASSITQLIGDVLATGPGVTTATVAFVGGKSAAAIASSVTDTQGATSANTFNAIVKRDGSGDIFVTHVNGVLVEAHASRHLPSGADPLTTAAPLLDLTAITTNATGTANSLSRSDHTHAIDTGPASTQTPDQSNTTGTSANLARADHVHNIPTGIPSSIGATNAQGSASAFTRQDHIHQGLHSIKANAGSQRFNDTSLQNGAGITIVDDGSGNFTFSSTAGTSELVTSIGTGLSINYTAGTVLINGTYTSIPAGSVSVGANLTNAWVYVSTSGVVSSGASLPAGTIALAQFTSNASNVTSVSDRRTFLDQNIQYGTPITDLTAITTNAAGSADSVSRSDHTHAIDTGPASTQTPDQSNATGSGSNLARADHVHNVPTGIASGLNANSTNTQGSASAFARQDHTHAISSGAASTQTPNQANAAGSSTNFARADHIHNIPTVAPVTQTPDQSNADGSAATFSRSDHIHNIPAATPVQIGTTNFKGAAASFSLSDHVHDHGAQTSGTLHAVVTTSVNGFMSAADKLKLDTNVPTTLGTSNQVLGVNNAGTAAEYKSLVGTANQITITDGVGSKTFSTPQDIGTSSSPTFANITDTGLTAKGAMYVGTGGLLSSTAALTNGQLLVGSTGASPVAATLTGTANQINITNAAGSITLSTPQDIATSSTPTFAGENLTNRLELTEQVAPSTPASTKIDIFAEASNGFTRLRVLDSTGVKNTLLRDSIILVKNVTGSTISSGKGIYYIGTDAGTNLPTIGLAKADSSNTVPCVGITIDNITNNSVGRVMAMGIATNIDTSAYAQGDKLYVSATTAGIFTTTKPTSPNIWQRVGIVLISNASTGAIEVRPFATHGEESGTNTAFTLNTVALTDAANIATNASLGNIFTVTLGGNRNLSAPTNPTNGQKITYRITQDGTGGRGLTFDAVFNFGLDIISFVPSSGANKIDYIGCIYNGATSKWDVVAVSKGFS